MLPANLRGRFLSALLDVPDIGSRKKRDTLLADLPSNVVLGLNRDENARTDLTLVLGQLDRLGRLTATGERPLIIVAQAALSDVEGFEAGRKLESVIKDLEAHYGRGEPAQPADASLTPVGRLPNGETPEAVIFGDERVSYLFVDRALAAAASVARLVVPRFIGGSWVGQPALGTGWVLAPGLVITNHHVIAARFGGERPAGADEYRAQAERARAWFDYRVEGGPREERAFVELVRANAELDYAILRLEDGAGRKPLALVRERPALARGDRLNIVQCPNGGPIKYAIRSNHYVATAGPGREHFLRYLTDTEGGSSGSPVFDDNWKVVALHHAAAPVPRQEHRGQITYVNNQGVSIHTILDDLPAALRREIATAQEGWLDAARA
jgi:endonuclease G, mitochondrial